MHICHINLAKGFRGGERQTLLLIEGLSNKGIKQTLICRKKTPMESKAKAIPNLTTIAIHKPFILHLLKCTDADFMHAHEGRSCHFAHLNYLINSTPYLITRRIPNKPKQNFITHRTYRNAQRIIALSHAIKHNLQQYDKQLPIEVIPSMFSDLSVNQNHVIQLQKKYQGKTLIGHIGALVNHHKGQQTIIQAAKTLQTSHPHVQFLLLGQGKDESWLKKQASGLNNIEFVGFIDNVGDYIKLFDLFVFPSWEEGLGSILLDIMQFQVPIIASNVDGIPDIIQHKHSGLLIEPKAAEQLTAAIIELLANAAYAHQLALNASQHLNNYSMDNIANRYLTVYQQLLR